ncbi:adenylyl-sulfate kinase [Candidatus Peregrinibacteria bacterium]|nr:adenylyl-sulfate kinase [Candidatus Peregrinibacteria bacterium]
MVIWIIGLSASGKTTLGRAIYKQWKNEAPNTVFLDGDDVRKIFRHENKTQHYTIEERKRNSDRICELCAWLDGQNINVVCSVLSLFEEARDWNRKTYSKYFEVFVDVPMDVLKKRETKGLYAAAEKGAIKNVAGVDIPFPTPKTPDFIFDNSQDNADFEKVAQEILIETKQL